MRNVSKSTLHGFGWVKDILSINKKLKQFRKTIKTMTKVVIKDTFSK